MKSTKKKIIHTAIDLFNLHGVGNVRIHDIAETAGISPGNLTYHFKTKKDLIGSVHRYMKKSLEEMTIGNRIFLGMADSVEVIRDYMRFQIQFRFFYRDILEIIRLQAEIKRDYQVQIEQIIAFNHNLIFLLIGKGYIIAEPYQGLYTSLSKNFWAVLNSWLSEREIMGISDKAIEVGISDAMDLSYPYLTEKGKEFHFKMKKELPALLRNEMITDS